MIDWEQIVDLPEIIDRLETDTGTIKQLWDTFPEPRHTLPSTSLWFWADVELWAEAHIGYDPYKEDTV